MRAALDKKAFLQALPGPAVLIRLDERGGGDEPAPWAFHGSGLPLPVDVPSSDEDVFVDRRQHTHIGADDSTLTGPTFSLSIPAARGRATLHVVPPGDAVVIGRGASCAVRVNERSVSREHARFVVEDASTGGRNFFIEARGHNNVAVNGERLVAGASRKVSSGDVVDLEDVSLLFLDANELYDGLPRLTSG
jgi:hypothetical protein